MDSILQKRTRRTSKLGRLGETLAIEALRKNGFHNIHNLNGDRNNHPFADLTAEKGGKRYIIEVKARNENRDVGELNESYNCVKVSDAANNNLKAQGLTKAEITLIALGNMQRFAKSRNAIAAWITVPIRPEDTKEGTYAVYFGLLQELGSSRSIPMTHEARQRYQCLVDWTTDSRITPDLSNRRRQK